MRTTSKVLLALVLCAMSATPGDLVWCRGDSGHDALELAWAGCCAPAGRDGSCSTDGSPGAAPSACTEGSCTDVPLSTAAVLSTSPRPPAPLPAATSPLGIPAGWSDSARSGARQVATPASRQVRDLLRATVLTI